MILYPNNLDLLYYGGKKALYIQENIKGHQEEAHANYHDASDHKDNFSGDHIHVLDMS